jgi:hypothetical protein
MCLFSFYHPYGLIYLQCVYICSWVHPPVIFICLFVVSFTSSHMVFLDPSFFLCMFICVCMCVMIIIFLFVVEYRETNTRCYFDEQNRLITYKKKKRNKKKRKMIFLLFMNDIQCSVCQFYFFVSNLICN